MPAPGIAPVIIALLILVSPLACLRKIVKLPIGKASFATLVLAYKSPIAKFAPPAVESKPYIADAASGYIAVEISSHNNVVAFQSLTLSFAPPFGTVVLNQILPDGLEVPVSVIFQVGTLVCAEICNAGGRNEPAVIPSSESLVASPPITTGPPVLESSAPELVPSLYISKNPSTASALIPGINALVIDSATSVTVFEPTDIVVPFTVISAVPAKLGFALAPFTVGQLLIQSLLPTATHEPLEFLYHNLLIVVTATIR